jgi:uncharacterized membrane protein
MIETSTAFAIFGMAAITYATRVAGLFLAGRLALSGRARAAFEAIPAAVLVALIAPAALTTGPAETIAALVTCVAAIRLPLLVTVMIGVATIIFLRSIQLF